MDVARFNKVLNRSTDARHLQSLERYRKLKRLDRSKAARKGLKDTEEVYHEPEIPHRDAEESEQFKSY